MHLVLGLSAALILFIIGITGALLSFEQEILSYINKSTYNVSMSSEKTVPVIDLLKEFKKEKTDVEISALKFSNVRSSSISIKVVENSKDQKRFTYYVNPYTQEVLENEKGVSFFRTVEKIHRELLLKNFGKQVIGFSVVSLIILLLSGVYLSLKKIKKQFFQSFLFSFKLKNRSFLSNIHSSLGMWLILFYLLSALSGLNWSYPWYNKTFHNIIGFPKPISVKVKESNINKNSKINSDTSIKNLSSAVIMFNSIIKHKYSYSFVRVPKEGTVYSFLYLDTKAKHRRERNKLLLDIKTKKIIKHERFEDKNLNEQIMISMLTIHTGEYFGVFGQILLFLSALILPFFGISGLLLLRKKIVSETLMIN